MDSIAPAQWRKKERMKNLAYNVQKSSIGNMLKNE